MRRFLIVFLVVALLTNIALASNNAGVEEPVAQVTAGKLVTESEIKSLFDRWNRAIQSRDVADVVALYAKDSILLPTMSNKPRLTPAEKEDYFRHFQHKLPSAVVDLRHIDIGTDMAVDSGLYTFTFAETGEVVQARYSFTYKRIGPDWLIVSHHSSLMPEKERSDQ